MPAPLGPEEQRPAFAQQHRPPFGLWEYRPIPDYDWGAARFAGQTGQLLYDPVGQGWIPRHRTDFPCRRTASYLNGSIFWNSTQQNLGMQPLIGPIYTPAQLRSIFGYRTASAIVALPNPYAPGTSAGSLQG